MRYKRALAYALVGPGLIATTMAFGGVKKAAAMDSIYECNQYNGGKQVALDVNHNTGVITPNTGTTTAKTIQAAINEARSNTTAPSSAGSGSGDTVLVCQGTYLGDVFIPTGNDNLTVRSEEGPNSVTVVGDGSSPVFNIDDRGLVLGGPAEGFTIEVNGPTATDVVGIHLGIAGAQNTANEDEQCMAAGTPVSTASGCDQAAPAEVTINDEISDNVLTNFRVASGANVTAIKLDNTINSTVQQNKVQNLVPGNVKAGTISGIVVGGFNEPVGDAPGTTAPPTDNAYQPGDSSDINTSVLQNAISALLPGSGSTCPATTSITSGSTSAVSGIEVDGFSLDSTVYNNLVQPLVDDDAATCPVVGIFSDAYGSLENEQTGTLAPVNANIDNNLIQQVGPKADDANAAGVVLEPTPTTANPKPATAPSGCVSNPPVSQSCQDTIPPSSYTVTQNELQQLRTAVDDEAVLGANSYIRDNNFDNDAIGVRNGAEGGTQNMSLDATNNWWGCELPGNSGPPSTPGSEGSCAALVNSQGGVTSWAPPQTARVEGAGQGAGSGAGNS